jgi:hypothetical protein
VCCWCLICGGWFLFFGFGFVFVVVCFVGVLCFYLVGENFDLGVNFCVGVLVGRGCVFGWCLVLCLV